MGAPCLTLFFVLGIMELCLDVINVDTMRSVGKSNAGCIWEGIFSELIIPRTRNN